MVFVSEKETCLVFWPFPLLPLCLSVFIQLSRRQQQRLGQRLSLL